tara:strand:- start:1283 stop:1558 length:276 start_codon:yes stop_codon:yes gene_type:complete
MRGSFDVSSAAHLFRRQQKKKSILPAMIATIALFLAFAPKRHPSELLSQAEVEALGIVWRGNATETSSHEHLGAVEFSDYPKDFTWYALHA